MNYFILLLQLYYEFLKVGLFSIGGGLATIPFLSEMGPRTGWFTQKMLADMIAVAESTPGPVGVNTATYAGFAAAGIPGSIIATLGLITPAIVVISIIAHILKKFEDNKIIKSIFYFLRPASLGLILSALISLIKMAFAPNGDLPDIPGPFFYGMIFAAILFILTNFVKPAKKLHPLVWIAASAVFGIIVF